MSKQDTYPPNFDRKSESSFPLARSDSGVGSKPRVTMEVYTGLEGEPAFSGKLWSK